MINICPGCDRPVLKGKALEEAKEMEQKQGADRTWWHIKCDDERKRNKNEKV